LRPIVQFPHPALRHPSKPLRAVDAQLRQIVREMFEAMYQARGVGLAANQVALPYRLFVVNLSADPAEKDQEHVFVNPVLSQPRGLQEEEEGCLSLPGLYGQVKRPARIVLEAYTLAGERFQQELEGMFARVVQHEADHLDGVLFIDRLSPTQRAAAREALDEFALAFESQQRSGQVPDEATIAAQLSELERLRC
jgi:peptide deformylase